MRVVKIECPNCHGSVDSDLENMTMECPYCRKSLAFDIDMDKYVEEKEKTKRMEYTYNAKKLEEETKQKDKKYQMIFAIVYLPIVVIVFLILHAFM